MNLKIKYRCKCKIDGQPIEGIARATPKGFICATHFEEEQKRAKEEMKGKIPEKEVNKIKKAVSKGV
jgi:hypothetical protein